MAHRRCAIRNQPDIDPAKIIAAIGGLVLIIKGSRSFGLIFRGLGTDIRMGRYRVPEINETANQVTDAIKAAYGDFSAGAEGDREWTGDDWE